MSQTTAPILILNDIRSCHNVGSILRTADGAGVGAVYCCGITPYPRLEADSRPERVISSNSKQIHKTALGAEETVLVRHADGCLAVITDLKADGYAIYALENNCERTQSIFSFAPAAKFALVLGSETDGLTSGVLSACDAVIEIPMRGTKNSLNVSVAAGIAIYRFAS
jgi:tRNA G18 (ribose-2'-O)-methylase SpoU